jgi:hypothetical protein
MKNRTANVIRKEIKDLEKKLEKLHAELEDSNCGECGYNRRCLGTGIDYCDHPKAVNRKDKQILYKELNTKKSWCPKKPSDVRQSMMVLHDTQILNTGEKNVKTKKARKN